MPRPRTARLAALLSTLALVAAGCGAEEELPSDPSVGPTTEDPEPDDADRDASGGTTMRVATVPEARAAEVDGSLHVTGLLIDDGTGWRLCESVLESFPPQCGGDALEVVGVDPSAFPLEEEGEVRWQTDATVVGELDGDTLTVTGSAASS